MSLQNDEEPRQADRRRALLDAAAHLLATEGPEALVVRKVAAAAGGSTQIVYTLFGGKDGLIDALYLEGVERAAGQIRRTLASAPPLGDPERLVAMCHCYRRFAAEQPGFFALMFGRAVPGYVAPAAVRARLQGRGGALSLLVEAAEACLEAGTLVAPSAEELVRDCWVVAHGVASLEAAGLLDDDEEAADRALRLPLLAFWP